MLQLIRVLLFLMAPGLLVACQQASSPHYDYWIGDKRGDTLVVFVAGLGGDDTWAAMLALLQQDQSLGSLDYLHYHTPKSLNFDENVTRLKSLVMHYRVGYQKVVYVGHSLGGIMIKRALIREANSPAAERVLPDQVITFGTPFNTNTFAISLFEKLGARVAWFFLPSLTRELFNIQHLARINSSWRIALEVPAIDTIEWINIFGYQDNTAPITQEREGGDTHFIPGDHLKIVQPRDAGDCSFQLLRALLLNVPPGQIAPCENR